jgi:hypothetical protein
MYKLPCGDIMLDVDFINIITDGEQRNHYKDSVCH